MRKLIFFILFCFVQAHAENHSSAITYYGREAGRLGDLLRLYIKTKWMAYRHKVPLLHKPFPFSDQFELHYKEKRFHQNLLQRFDQKVQINHDPDYIDPHKGILYEVGYFPFIITPWGGALKDKKFIRLIKELIKPHNSIAKPILPENIKTVAVHIRKGGGADLPLASQQIYKEESSTIVNEIITKQLYADHSWPLKFPPTQYYIDQIIRLSEMFDDQPLYLYIFTDDQNPPALVNLIKTNVNKPNITFDCRKQGNHHAKNIIEDFFSITQFDCLIRGGSHYSEAAHIIGDYEIAIYPKRSTWEGNKLIITEVGIIFENNWHDELTI